MKPIRGHVYFIRPVGRDGPVKIGVSANPSLRLPIYMSWSPDLLELVATTPGDDKLERRFHARFAALHMHHEWFRADPELSEAIRQVQAGTFDVATLPPPLPQSARRTAAVAEGHQRAGLSHRLNRLRKLRVPIPADIRSDSCWLIASSEPLAVRRARVEAFVNAKYAELGLSRHAGAAA